MLARWLPTSCLVALLAANLAALSGAPWPEAAKAQDMQPSQIAVTMNDNEKITDYEMSPNEFVVNLNEPIQFVIRNLGSDRHRFNVGGFGERWRAENDQPGETAIVDATFTIPGVYEVWCSSVTDAGSHRDLGMVGTLTVLP